MGRFFLCFVLKNINEVISRVYIYRCAYFTRIYIGTLGKRPHFFFGGGRVLTWGRRVPASALPSWGSIPQLGNKRMYCICLSRHRALTSKCRRGDASPPGEDALPAGKGTLSTGKGTLSAGEGTLSTGEDALHAHPYIYHYILFRISDRFLCPSCSIQRNRYG